MARRELLALSDAALLAQCQVDRIRGSGSGGQKRNKTSTAVRLRHGATGLAALSDDSRSQHQNKDRALKRLRERFAFELRESVDLDDYQVPSELSAILTVEVRKSDKWLNQPRYLLAAGALLDLYQALGCSLAEVGRRLDVSQAVLTRLARADQRLQRKLGELRTTMRGRPIV